MSFEIREFTGVVGVIQANGALAHAHRSEFASEFEGRAWNPDLQRYQLLEDAGLIVAVGAYDGDELVGYSINVLSVHLHYQLPMGRNDVLYLAPAYRQGHNGNALMDATRDALQRRGAAFAVWSAKPDTPLHKLLEHGGATVLETVFHEALQ